MSFDWSTVPPWLAPILEEVVDGVAAQHRGLEADLAAARKQSQDAQEEAAELRAGYAAARAEVERWSKLWAGVDLTAARAEIARLRAQLENEDMHTQRLVRERREETAKLAALRAQSSAATRLESFLDQWIHQMGAALKPPGADTYGEGMRDAKERVSRMMRAARTGTPEPGKEGDERRCSACGWLEQACHSRPCPVHHDGLHTVRP